MAVVVLQKGLGLFDRTVTAFGKAWNWAGDGTGTRTRTRTGAGT